MLTRLRCCQTAGTARIERCRQRSANAGHSGEAGLRSRNGVAIGHHVLDHRPDALRCLRPARSIDDVHAVEPVSRDIGGDAELRSKAAESERSLYPLGDGERRPVHGAVSGGSAATSSFGPSSAATSPTAVAAQTASSASSPAELRRPLPLRRFRRARCNRRPRFPTAARCLSARSRECKRLRPRSDQPPGSVPGDHAFLQSFADRISRRRYRRRE